MARTLLVGTRKISASTLSQQPFSLYLHLDSPLPSTEPEEGLLLILLFAQR